MQRKVQINLLGRLEIAWASDSYIELTVKAGTCCFVNLAELLWEPELCYPSGSIGIEVSTGSRGARLDLGVGASASSGATVTGRGSLRLVGWGFPGVLLD